MIGDDEHMLGKTKNEETHHANRLLVRSPSTLFPILLSRLPIIAFSEDLAKITIFKISVYGQGQGNRTQGALGGSD